MNLSKLKLQNAFAARTSRFAPQVKSMLFTPDPRSIGTPSKGQDILNGEFLFAGFRLKEPSLSIWDISAPNSEFTKALHGFSWLDDLAALGSKKAHLKCTQWLWQWIASYGNGINPVWEAQLTGRRVLRMINHADFLLQNQDNNHKAIFLKSLGRQARFLRNRWKSTVHGLPRIETLSGIIQCGISLDTKDKLLKNSVRALGSECKKIIKNDGSIPSRNPEELMHIFTLLSWSAQSLRDANHQPDPEHLHAIKRIAPTLRALRFSNGSLAHFHGSSRGNSPILNQALSATRIPTSQKPLAMAMGYYNLSNSDTQLLIDADAKPEGAFAHDSPLAFEMSSGTHMLLINLGPGHIFSPAWHKFSKKDHTHNCLSFFDNPPKKPSSKKYIRPLIKQKKADNSDCFLGMHKNYVKTNGLIHTRRLDLSHNGKLLQGYDYLSARTDEQKKKYDHWKKNHQNTLPCVAAHFHIHPDTTVKINPIDQSIILTQPNNNVWVFTSQLGYVTLENSYYGQMNKLNPRLTKQIMVTCHLIDYDTVITWSLKQTHTGQA